MDEAEYNASNKINFYIELSKKEQSAYNMDLRGDQIIKNYTESLSFLVRANLFGTNSSQKASMDQQYS